MDVQELAERHPHLHHVTTAGAWSTIATTGLLSTRDLLDRFEVPEPMRSTLETRPRPEAVELTHPRHGRAVLFDNRPLRLEILERCLDCSVEEWCRLLNARVFFWATERRLENHLRARGHRGQQRDVITVSTARLLERCAEKVTLCGFNSGSALYPNAPRRGPESFQTVSDYPYDEQRRRRGRANALAEVCVTGRIDALEEIVDAVTRVDPSGERTRIVTA